MEESDGYETDWEEILLDSFKQKNNIVVTTKCNLNCIFCSRKYNPFQSKQSHVKFNDIRAQMGLLKPNSMIYINSSISRLTDGEPFSHPRIWDILFLLRKMFPFRNTHTIHGKINITTNGTLLTDSALKRLEELKGIIIIHSINSTDLEDYMKLSQTSEKIARIAISIPRRIKNFIISYVPSIVAVPSIVGFEGIEETLRDLNENDVKYTRVFLPTYTKYAPEEAQKMLYCDQDKFYSLIEGLKKELEMKILLYPTKFKDLKPKLEGYERLGINPTDEIMLVDGVKPFSRWHAQSLLLDNDKKSYVVKLKDSTGNIKEVTVPSREIRIDNYINVRINKDMPYLSLAIKNATRDYKKILVVPSQTSENIVKEAFEKIKKEEDFAHDKEFYFQTVYNDFYGGSVICAGLLTCQDYKEYIKKFIDENFKPDLVLISDDAFDVLGRDLLKESIFDVMDELDVRIKRVSMNKR